MTEVSFANAMVARTAAVSFSLCPYSLRYGQLHGIADNIVGVPFCVATCPKCSEQFRLVWRIGKKKLAPSAVIRPTCPACAHSFEQVAVGPVVFDARDGFLWKNRRW
jgi:hypothetical protein